MKNIYLVFLFLLSSVQFLSSMDDELDLEHTYNGISGALYWVKLKEYDNAMKNIHCFCQKELEKLQIDEYQFEQLPDDLSFWSFYINTLCLSFPDDEKKQIFGFADLNDGLGFVHQRKASNKILSLVHFVKNDIIRYFYQSRRGSLYYIEKGLKKKQKLLSASKNELHYIVKGGDECVVTVTLNIESDEYVLKLWQYNGTLATSIIFDKKKHFSDIVDIIPCKNDAFLATVILEDNTCFLVNFFNETMTLPFISTNEVGSIDLFFNLKDGLVFGGSKNKNCFGLWALLTDENDHFFYNETNFNYLPLWEFDCECKIVGSCLMLPHLFLLKDEYGELVFIYLSNGETIFSCQNKKMKKESRLHFYDNLICDVESNLYQNYKIINYKKILDQLPLSDVTIERIKNATY